MAGHLASVEASQASGSLRSSLAPYLNKSIEYGLVAYVFFLPFAALNHWLEYFFLTLVGLWIVREVCLQRLSLHRTPMDVPLLAFIGWVLLTVVSATDVSYSLGEWQKSIPKVLMFFFVVSALEGERPVRRIILALVAGACLQSVIGLVKFFVEGGELFSYIHRAAALTSSSQWLSTFLLMAVPFIWLGLTHDERPAFRWLYGSGLVLSLAALVLAHTRGAWVALIVQIIVLGCMKVSRNGYVTTAVATVSVLCFFVIMVFLPGQVRKQLSQLETTRMYSMMIRFNTWELAASDIAEHPVTGLGFGRHSFNRAHTDLQSRGYHTHIHNTFLSMAVQVGIPGLLLFLWIFHRVVVRSFRTWREQAGLYTARLSQAVLLMAVGVMVRNLFDDMFVGTLVYLFCLLVALKFSLDAPPRSSRGLDPTG